MRGGLSKHTTSAVTEPGTSSVCPVTIQPVSAVVGTDTLGTAMIR